MSSQILEIIVWFNFIATFLLSSSIVSLYKRGNKPIDEPTNQLLIWCGIQEQANKFSCTFLEIRLNHSKANEQSFSQKERLPVSLGTIQYSLPFSSRSLKTNTQTDQERIHPAGKDWELRRTPAIPPHDTPQILLWTKIKLSFLCMFIGQWSKPASSRIVPSKYVTQAEKKNVPNTRERQAPLSSWLGWMGPFLSVLRTRLSYKHKQQSHSIWFCDKIVMKERQRPQFRMLLCIFVWSVWQHHQWRRHGRSWRETAHAQKLRQEAHVFIGVAG